MTRAEAYQDLFMLFCGRAVQLPTDLERLSHLPDSSYAELQTIAANSKLPWLTGIGVLEAMDTLIDESIANSEGGFQSARRVFGLCGVRPARMKSPSCVLPRGHQGDHESKRGDKWKL